MTTTTQSHIHRNKQKDILHDLKICWKSRFASNSIRREVLNGKAKFGIEGGGKELAQVCLARVMQAGDYLSCYYRDQTFLLAAGLCTISQLFAALYSDGKNDPFSGGRQMNNHFATAFLDHDCKWVDQTSSINIASGLAPLAGNITHALGLALASKKYKENPQQKDAKLFSKSGNELSVCTLGDATTSEGVFFEALNAACVMKVPLIYVIYDDGHGISVPTKYQTTKESISEILEGFRINEEGEGAYIYTANGWDYEEINQVFFDGFEKVRASNNPAVFHIKECTQPNGHSTSGSHNRYKSKERLEWEKEFDCITQFESWIIDNGINSLEEISEWKSAWEKEVKKDIKNAWTNANAHVKKSLRELEEIYNNLLHDSQDNDELGNYITKLKEFHHPVLSDLLKHAETVLILAEDLDSAELEKLQNWQKDYKGLLIDKYEHHLHSECDLSPIHVSHVPTNYKEDAPMVNGSEILKTNFDSLFEKYDNLYAFGEDLGKIGGVNQAMAGLQSKYGEERIFDTGIREWTIVGQAIGMAMRGLRPIAEIQYVDYIHYAMSPLADDLATLRYRSNGQQKAPAIIRTRGHRLEGIWHSGSPIAMLLNSMRGIHICVPRNMTQAAGLYNTLLQGDDPAIIIEVLNGYRKKERLPANPGEFTVPIGSIEILNEGTDVTLVTYGACVSIAEEAIRLLSKKGVSVELIDAQTLMPFDLDHGILNSLQKTNRIVFLDEDVPGGTTAFMYQQVLELQNGFQYLDSAPITISAREIRPPYGDDGDYYSKPQVLDVYRAIYAIMKESNPNKF